MKKLISFALAVVLCLGMSTTVLAAPSPEINSPSVNNGPVEGKVTVQNLNDAQKKAVESYGSATAMVEAIAGVEVIGELVEIELEAEVDPVNGTWVKMGEFRDLDYSKERLVVIHMDENGNIDQRPDGYVAENGYAYGNFTSLSPVWYFVAEVETQGHWYYDPAIDGPVDPSTVPSPKTADNSMTLYVMMLAVAACGTMVLKTRKAK